MWGRRRRHQWALNFRQGEVPMWVSEQKRPGPAGPVSPLPHCCSLSGLTLLVFAMGVFTRSPQAGGDGFAG